MPTKTKDYTSRRDRILQMIIDTYIDTAAPIASRAISRKLRLSLSPASVRNVMSDLEELGLIMHPHTSAGRVPTEKGYRYYIDKLMRAELLTEEEKKRVDKEFKTKIKELDELLYKTSNLISSLTNQAGIVLLPMLQRSVFRHAELVKIDHNRLLVVLMTNAGFAKDYIIDTDDDIDAAKLLRIANLINSYIDKGSLGKIRNLIVERLLAERDSFFYVLDKAKDIIDVMLDIAKENRVYLDGRVCMAGYPEFNDIDKLRNLFEHLEDRDFILSMLQRELDTDGIKIRVGSELGEDFSECSLIVSNYCIGDNACGALGVIGPTRMAYPKLVSIVEYVASSLSRHLSE